MISSIFLLSTILVLSAAAPAAELRGYVVYTGAASPSNLALKEAIINRMSGQLLRTYRHGFSGFAARLSPQEATFISMQPGVVSVFEDTYLKLLTTRSWGFLASLEGSYANPAYPYACSSDIVVGFIDSGIWPESESFRPASSAPPPVGWNGTCQTSKDFNMSSCNGKIVGARFYVGESARDVEGHGSHVASTAAGMEVKASYYGLAAGTARGGSESARIAVYKACLPLFGCLSSAILSAFDDAIRDGVNVISVSVGSTQLTPLDFTEDPIAIGAFHATERGILVVCAGGNSGPARSSIKNDAPWILTVAASTMDRNFETNVVLAGANKTIKGRSIGFSKLSRSPIYPLTTGEAAVDKNRQAARECHLDSLKASKVKGKIVVCETSASTTYLSDQRAEIVSKGGVGMVVVSDTESRVPGFYGDFPITIVSLEEANKLMTYLNTTRNPMGTILGTVTVGHQKPAPEVAFFSSRGPSMVSGNIIKASFILVWFGLVVKID
ncbi:unnamed protein product [Linum tenue]|uniref:Uncharacterized protein n=1 Tax=Linum tenue TaxID=586396 RepID=A0AAV0HBW5_9ROSI|nr:unnamed protein product [Linum tenue]